MGNLMGSKTLNGYNFGTNKDIDMQFSTLLFKWSRLLINDGIKHPYAQHTHTNFNGLLLNGAKTIRIIQT